MNGSGRKAVRFDVRQRNGLIENCSLTVSAKAEPVLQIGGVGLFSSTTLVGKGEAKRGRRKMAPLLLLL